MKSNFRGFFNCGAGLLLFLFGISAADDDVFGKLINSSYERHAIAVVVDANGGNLDKVKDLVKKKSYSYDGEVWFGVLREPDYENPISLKNMQDLTTRIHLLQSQNVTNKSSDDIYTYFLKLMSVMPSDSCIILFTETKLAEEPQRRSFFEKLHEKWNKVFIFWIGDLPYDVEALQSITESSRGSVVVIHGTSAADEYAKEILHQAIETSDGEQTSLQKTSQPRILTDMLQFSESETQQIVKRLGEVATLGENDQQENLHDKFGKVKFPEDGLEKMDNASAVFNFLNANTTMARQSSKSLVYIPLRVEVASESNLECLLGTDNSIIYDVKNNQPISTLLTFEAQSQNVGVIDIVPRRITLLPTKSVKVEVKIQPLATTQDGTEARLDFKALTIDRRPTVRITLLRFKNEPTIDNTAPSITYEYIGNCKGHDTPDTCENGEWKIEATFQDKGSGLKKVLSEPYGLVFKEKFSAGTQSPVSVYYAASCCQPKIDIWAEDGKRNVVHRSLDLNNQGLQSGEIAAIIVGVILVIFIIITLIVTVVFLRRRNQRKLIIPRYQSSN